MSDNPAAKKVFFHNLDAFRFCAFFLVFLQHGFYEAFVAWEGKNFLLDKLIQTLFLSGGTGVQIFFVLSGFLITYLILKEIEWTGKLNVPQFYMRRTLRIWPLYFATVIFAFIIYPWLKGLIGIDSQLCSQPWYYFTFLANFDLINIAVNCPGQDAMTQAIVWSVAIEEQFYLVWPLLFLLFPRKYPWLIFVIVLCICSWFRWTHMHTPGHVNYYHTLAVMGDLAIGGLGALLMQKNWCNEAIKKISRKGWIILYTMIGLLYFFKVEWIKGEFLEAYARYVFDTCWLLIILSQCFSNRLPIELGKWRWASKMGIISYGFYMLHPVGILVVDIVLRLTSLNTENFYVLLLRGVVALALTFLIAHVSYRWMELPFLKLKRKFAVIKTT